jgi:signal peptidase I
MRKLLDILIYVAIIIGLVFGLPKALSYALNTNYPMAAITSGSMWPELKEGDLVFIKGVKVEQIKVGDIVVFKDEISNKFIIHRITKINSNTFVTKGDANFQEDAPTKFENLVGNILTFKNKNVRIPYLGSVTVFANNLRAENKP